MLIYSSLLPTVLKLTFCLIQFLVQVLGDTDPCIEHKELNDDWRGVNNGDEGQCDRYLEDAWYRLNSTDGDVMPTTSPGIKKCGTMLPIWLNGAIPPVSEGEVTRQACVHVFLPCDISWEIRVKNCSQGYVVYYLRQASGCSMAYCIGTVESDLENVTRTSYTMTSPGVDTQTQNEPTVYSLPNNGLCDKQVESCESTSVFGDGFEDSDNLICNFNPFCVDYNGQIMENGESQQVPGVFQSDQEVICELPTVNMPRRDSIACGYNISLSTDGLEFSDEVTLLVFDGRCITCNLLINPICFIKLDMCYIDRGCVHSGQTHETEACKSCTPENSAKEWSNSNNCSDPFVTPGPASSQSSAPTFMTALVVILAVLLIAVILSLVFWKCKSQKKPKIGSQEILEDSTYCEIAVNNENAYQTGDKVALERVGIEPLSVTYETLNSLKAGQGSDVYQGLRFA